MPGANFNRRWNAPPADIHGMFTARVKATTGGRIDQVGNDPRNAFQPPRLISFCGTAAIKPRV